MLTLQWNLLQLSNVCKRTKRALKANEHIYIPFSLGTHRHTERGHHGVSSLPVVLFIHFLRAEDPGSQNTQKHTKIHIKARTNTLLAQIPSLLSAGCLNTRVELSK